MPETENRSLEDIEMHFSDDSKRITDRHIAYVQSKQNQIQDIQLGNGDTTVDTIHSHENIAMGSRHSGESKLKCDTKNAHENRGFVGDTLEWTLSV